MIFITGDTHCPLDIHKLNSKNFLEGRKLTKKDYVIICGDFGLLWNEKFKKEEEYWTKWLNNKSWTTLFVDGNHEEHNRLYNLSEVEMFNSKVGKVTHSIFHLKRGNIYTIENKKFFVMGGAESTDKKSRILNYSWWEAEQPSQQEYNHGLDNLEREKYKVDYVLTHTCPQSILQKLDVYNKNSNSIVKYLDLIYKEVDFKLWFCGHFHTDERIEDVIFCYNKIHKLEV